LHFTDDLSARVNFEASPRLDSSLNCAMHHDILGNDFRVD